MDVLFIQSWNLFNFIFIWLTLEWLAMDLVLFFGTWLFHGIKHFSLCIENNIEKHIFFLRIGAIITRLTIRIHSILFWAEKKIVVLNLSFLYFHPLWIPFQNDFQIWRKIKMQSHIINQKKMLQEREETIIRIKLLHDIVLEISFNMKELMAN